MQEDFDRLDPDIRMKRQYAIASAALGTIGFCAGIVPTCGLSIAALGIILGVLSLRIEPNRTAWAGIILSALAIFITLAYVAVQLYIVK